MSAPYSFQIFSFQVVGGWGGGGLAGLLLGQRRELVDSPDGGLGAVRELDSGTPEAECQWWADRLGDEWGWLAHPRFSLLWMRLRSLGGFFAQGAHGEAARRRGPALAGGGPPHFR